MQIIAHRVNQIAQLNSLSLNYGVEIDVRSAGDRLILSHDPFCDGDDLDDWLMAFKHKTIIVNPEEGLEERILSALQDHGVSNFFFSRSINSVSCALGKEGIEEHRHQKFIL